MVKTDALTAIAKLKAGHKVVSIVSEIKHPSFQYTRRYEYDPERDYSITRGHLIDAEWFYEE